jgi:glycosyltransferase involved in cell wall biosynthesis
MNISFLTSGHEPLDDRIFFHMARSLADRRNSVEIVSSKSDLCGIRNGINLNCFPGENLSKREKIKQFHHALLNSDPDLIICSEPLPIIAARRYLKQQNKKIRIIYDITEWYPSKKNLSIYKPSIRWIFFLKLMLFNILVAGFADSFIFGEWFKSKPYRLLYPFKSYIFTPYYPDLKYINYCKPAPEKGKLRLTYSGKISLEKGYENFFRVIYKLQEINEDLKVEVKIIGWYENLRDKNECEHFMHSDNPDISIKIFDKQDFHSFMEIIKDTDIFLDLRADDFENQYCLPIKLFYYAAFGRPVIFTDLKAIRKEVEIEKFGYLVRPDNTGLIADLISEYLKNENLYLLHCNNARDLAENDYNWKKNEIQFIKFLAL